METIALLNTAIADVKDTSSTKVEWTGSLEAIINSIKNLVLERGVATAFTIDELKAYRITETRYVCLYDQGATSTSLYSYREASGEIANNSTSFDAADGGLWKKAELPST